MKMDNEFPERMGIISRNEFLNFYFLKVDISLTMHDLTLKLSTCIVSIAVEETYF